MKVIHIVLGKSNPERMNGVNRVVNQLATVQHQQGLDVEVWGITKTNKGALPSVVYKLRLYKAFKNPFKMDDEMKVQIAAAINNAIFHIHGGFVPVFSTVAKYITKCAGKYIVSPHGTYSIAAVSKSNGLVKKIYMHFFESTLLENAAYVHLLGKSSNEGVKHLKIREKVIPNGYSIQDITKRTFYQHDVPVFGFVGRLSMHHKGLDLMLEGFSLYLKKGNKEARLWLVGDGESGSTLREMAEKLKIRDNVIFWGSRFGQEKEELFVKMDYFLHTSRHEGLPTAMIEAAAFGIPLVGSEGTNFNEYIEEYRAGVALKKNTVEEIAEAFLTCEHMLPTEEYGKIAENARKLAEEKFDWRTIHNSFVELYKTV